MSIRTMQLFVLPDELLALLAERCARLDLVASVYQPPLTRDCRAWTGDLRHSPIDWRQCVAGQRRIMLHPPADGAIPPWGEVVTARLGWVDVRVGNLRDGANGHTLEMSDIGAKSDYFEYDAVLEDPRSLQVHRRITRPLKAALRRPMQAWHVAHSDRARTYDIYYSDRAAAFYHEGGELMQQGVANIRFSPQDHALPSV
jgi:hypothetical protein